MGRTIPSFRIVLEMEKEEWKPFRNALDKSERKHFDDMWDIPRLYASACSSSCQLVPVHPIIISILFHHYKELIECISEVEQIIEEEASGANYSVKQKDWLKITEEERKEKVELPISTLDGYFIHNNADFK